MQNHVWFYSRSRVVSIKSTRGFHQNLTCFFYEAFGSFSFYKIPGPKINKIGYASDREEATQLFKKSFGDFVNTDEYKDAW